ncbi:TMEM175 family protein [Streptomyces canus]|uniref:TMEM175 family protein n=1 Tax=Streptomyces canus TaxID=58343 RepID=UPI0033FEE516
MTNPLRGLFRRDTNVEPGRLATFGDAVFSIAITLLALEINVPDGLDSSKVASALRDTAPAIGAYLLSFVVIGVLWLTQHALFRLIAVIDRCLLFLYFALLANVAALPFPTRLISEYSETATATWFYAASITLSIGLLCSMYVRVLTRLHLASAAARPDGLRTSIRRSLVMILVFASSIPVSFASPAAAKYWWLLAVPARMLFRDVSDATRVAVSKSSVEP